MAEFRFLLYRLCTIAPEIEQRIINNNEWDRYSLLASKSRQVICYLNKICQTPAWRERKITHYPLKGNKIYRAWYI